MEDILVERFVRFLANGDPRVEVLRVGDQGIGVGNVRAALGFFSFGEHTENHTLFDDRLKFFVREFQIKYGHSTQDGLVGPGTRRLLVSMLLAKYGPNIFYRLPDPEKDLPPSVFISYATADTPVVDKLDQWLRDRQLRVVRYTHSFAAGGNVLDRARGAIAAAGKVIVVHSAQSARSDWVRAEIALAEELERRLLRPVIIYVVLDQQPLPQHDQQRIAIAASGKSLKMVGEELLHAIAGRERLPPRFDYNEDELL